MKSRAEMLKFNRFKQGCFILPQNKSREILTFFITVDRLTLAFQNARATYKLGCHATSNDRLRIMSSSTSSRIMLSYCIEEYRFLVDFILLYP